MRKIAAAILLVLLLSPALAACGCAKVVTQPPAGTGPGIAASAATPESAGTAVTAPAGMPARPGSGATGDPSGHLIDYVDVSGVVKEVKEGLVLITTDDGGEYMLRFSENSKWDDNVDRTIAVGNRITARVKPEPMFAPPSQGEVYLVIGNAAK